MTLKGKYIFTLLAGLFCQVYVMSQKITTGNIKIDTLTSILKSNKNDTAVINILNSMATQFGRTGNYPKALEYVQAAQLKFETLNISLSNIIMKAAKKGYANSFRIKGAIFNLIGNYEKAIDNNLRSIALIKESGDKQELAIAYSGLGNIYFAQGNSKKTIEYFNSALKITEELGNKQELSRAYNNLGVFYFKQSDFNLSLEYYLKALKIHEVFKDEHAIAYSYFNLGTVYFIKGVFKKGLDVNYQWPGFKDTAIYNYSFIEKEISNRNPLEKAAVFLNQSFILAKKTGDKRLIREVYNALAELYNKMQHYKAAFEYSNLYSLMNDTLFNEQSNKQMTEINTKYETEKKEKEIIMLNMEREIKEAEILLQRKNQQMIVISAMILFVLIFLISALVFRNYRQRQKANLESIEKEKIKAELNLLKNQISPHVMFNTLNTIYFQMDEDTLTAREMVLQFADLLRYQLYECNVEFTGIEKEINYLNKFIEIQRLRKSKRCKMDFKIGDNVKDFLIAPLLLIALVENAFKYVTNDKDSDNYVSISLTKNESLMQFTIENTFHESESYDMKTSGGIGLNNLQNRLNLIYPNRNELILIKENNIFTAKLKINV